MRKLRLGTSTTKGPCSPRFFPASPKREIQGDPRLSGGRPVSFFPTWKGGKRMVGLPHYFHALMACLAEADPDTVEWDVCNIPVDYVDRGKQCRFVPDFVLRTRQGDRFVRLIDGSAPYGDKPSKSAAEVKLPPAYDGASFERLTRSQLETHPRLQTSREILHHRPRLLGQNFPAHVAGMHAMRPFGNLGELHGRLGATQGAWFDALSLVARGHVEVDMAEPLDGKMPVLSCTEKGLLA